MAITIQQGKTTRRPNSTERTLTSNEVFTYQGGDHMRFFLDPVGGNRSLIPSGSFPAGFMFYVVHTGAANNIVVNPTGKNQSIGVGELGIYLIDASGNVH